MICKDRLEFYDQCIAGDRAQFNLLLSKEIFNTFDRGYELYRDYILKKNSIKNIQCVVKDKELIVHLKSDNDINNLISENMPKRGILSTQTDSGVDIHITLINPILV